MLALRNPNHYAVPEKYKETILKLRLENNGLIKYEPKTFDESDVNELFRRLELIDAARHLEKQKRTIKK